MNKIWKHDLKLEDVTHIRKNTMVDFLGIKFTEVGDDYLKATMPVDHRTIQPMGILHGGASCVLAETIASIGGNYCVDQNHYYCVGLDINTNHIRTAKDGIVTGVAKPIHLGKTTQVWEIKIYNPQEQLVSISRLTLAVLKKSQPNNSE